MFLGLSMAGLYPAEAARHVAWCAGMGWSLIVLGARGAEVAGSGATNGRAGTWWYGARRVLLVGMMGLSLVNALSFFVNDGRFEQAGNDEAIAWLENLPPSDVGLWVGGQPVLDSYMPTHPALARHAWFGRVNERSADMHTVIAAVAGRPADELDFAALKDCPGAWGVMAVFKAAKDYRVPADLLVAEAPRGRDFLIFASHYDLVASDGFSRARVNGLHEALTARGCIYGVARKFERVVLYTARCPE